MTYDQRIMRFQQSTINDCLKQASTWRILKGLYRRFEWPLIISGLAIVFVGAVINKIG